MKRCRAGRISGGVFACLALSSLLLAAGCGPMIAGVAGTATYKAASDERTVGRMIDDTTLTVKINGRLAEDESLPVHRIDVDVLDGHVTLTGVVATREQRDRAAAIAAGVEGVTGVTNNLQVGVKTISQAMRDTWLGSRIKARLLADPHVRALNIDVDVDRGVAILTGLVASETQRARALEIARTTKGVVRVVDNLRVD